MRGATAKNLRDTVMRVLVAGKDERSVFKDESQFLVDSLRSCPVAEEYRSGMSTMDFKLFIRSMSYCTQLFGPLKEPVNVVLHQDEIADSICSFVQSYYEFCGMAAAIDSTDRIASVVKRSWSQPEEFPVFHEKLLMLTQLDFIMGNYSKLIALESLLDVTYGCLVFSTSPFTEYSDVVSKTTANTAGPDNLAHMSVLNLSEYREKYST